MNKIFSAIDGGIQLLLFYAKSAKDRNTTKALITAGKAQKMFKLIDRLETKSEMTTTDLKKIRAYKKKEAAYWNAFNQYIAAN